MKKKKLKKQLRKAEARYRILLGVLDENKKLSSEIDDMRIQLQQEKDQKVLWIERCNQLKDYKAEALAARSDRGGYGP